MSTRRGNFFRAAATSLQNRSTNALREYLSYWTQRTEASGYNDGARYQSESQRRLLANLGNPDAVVHGIGGIGDAARAEDLVAFTATLAASGAVGGSVYDWATLSDSNIALLNRLFADWPEVE